MSTLKTTYLQHPSSASPNLELKADGTVTVLPNGLLQVVQSVKTDTFSASVAAGGSVGLTGLSVSITPSSASNKILIVGNISGSSSGVYTSTYTINRDSVSLANPDSPGSRLSTLVTQRAADQFTQAMGTVFYLDSPATTSAVVYDITLFNPSGSTYTLYVNRSSDDTDSAARTRDVSTLTAMEIAG